MVSISSISCRSEAYITSPIIMALWKLDPWQDLVQHVRFEAVWTANRDKGNRRSKDFIVYGKRKQCKKRSWANACSKERQDYDECHARCRKRWKQPYADHQS